MTMDATFLSPKDEALEFLMTQPTPGAIIDFKPSEMAQARMSYLLEASRSNQLTATEQVELDENLALGHWMNQLRLKAREKLASI
jgi:hypothetical protein